MSSKAIKTKHAGTTGIRVCVQKPGASGKHTTIYISERNLKKFLEATEGNLQEVTDMVRRVSILAKPSASDEPFSRIVVKSALHNLQLAKLARDEAQAKLAAENNAYWEQNQ